MLMDLSVQIETDGYGITKSIFDAGELCPVVQALSLGKLERSRAGIRHILKESAISEIANSKEMLSVAEATLGGCAVPFRATLFDKSRGSN
jgi:hypothetical protein